MKIRAGFVSNSSSSSFIVALKFKPETEDELHSMLFPDGATTVTTYFSNETLDSKEVAARVFKDINKKESEITAKICPDEPLRKGEKPSTSIWQKVFRIARNGSVAHPREVLAKKAFDQAVETGSLTEEIMNEYIVSKDMWEPPVEETEKNWKSRLRKRQQNYERWLKKYVKDFISKIRGYFVYKLQYSDNVQGEELLEHGDIFRNVPHIRISEH